jgi:hypothetical protein
MLHEVRAVAHTFNIFHFHTDLLHFPLIERCALRTVTTVHGRLDSKTSLALIEASRMSVGVDHQCAATLFAGSKLDRHGASWPPS